KNPPDELLVTPAEIFFYRVGNVQALSVLVLNEAGAPEDVHLSKSTRYQSSDEAISLISSQGVVTAKAVGDATIEVHYRGVTKKVAVHVVPGADGGPVVRITQPLDGSTVTSERVPLSGLASDPFASLLLNGAPLGHSRGSFS